MTNRKCGSYNSNNLKLFAGNTVSVRFFMQNVDEGLLTRPDRLKRLVFLTHVAHVKGPTYEPKMSITFHYNKNYNHYYV